MIPTFGQINSSLRMMARQPQTFSLSLVGLLIIKRSIPIHCPERGDKPRNGKQGGGMTVSNLSGLSSRWRLVAVACVGVLVIALAAWSSPALSQQDSGDSSG